MQYGRKNHYMIAVFKIILPICMLVFCCFFFFVISKQFFFFSFNEEKKVAVNCFSEESHPPATFRHQAEVINMNTSKFQLITA